MTTVLLGDLLTGRIYAPIPFSQASLSCRLNGAGTIEVTVTLTDDAVRYLGLKGAAAPGKNFLAWEENDVILEAGPIWSQTYDDDTAKLTITASGLWSYFDHRVVLPPSAATLPFFITDPNAYDTIIPNTALDTSFTNASLGTIAKRVIQQEMGWANGNLPIVFQADDTGSASFAVAGVDLQYAGDVLRDINELTNGPDIEFTPSRTADRQSVQWTLRTGTTAKPDLGALTTHVWDMSVDESPVKSLKVDMDGSARATQTWAVGGKSSDTSIITRAQDPTLTNAGYPILETVLSDRNDLSSITQLQSYANEQVRLGKSTTETWSFSVRADVFPKLGEYRVGDYAQLTVGPGNPYVDAGVYLRRILSFSTDESAQWVQIATGEVYTTNGAAV